MTSALTSAKIHAFNAVVEEGGFTKAAARLGVSQPAVTQHVSELETAFGVKLFARSYRGGAELTSRGRRLYQVTAAIALLEADAVAILTGKEVSAAPPAPALLRAQVEGLKAELDDLTSTFTRGVEALRGSVASVAAAWEVGR